MHHLILDTNVLSKLAVEQHSLAPKLASLIKDNNAKLLIPEQLQAEWNAAREPIQKEITDLVVKSRRQGRTFLDYAKEDTSTERDGAGCEHFSGIDTQALGNKIAMSSTKRHGVMD